MTFSIVARDKRNGTVGVATATAGPLVGSLVPHARAGAGAIATQAQTNPLYGFEGLDLLAEGIAAPQIVTRLTAADPGRAHRQLLVLDRTGVAAGWTGSACNAKAGHRLAANLAVGGNYLANLDVLEAMEAAFEGTPDAPLETRLLAAMVAGAKAGGDGRGLHSAALKTYTGEPYPAIDLRIDWAENPIRALAELLTQAQGAYYAAFVARVPTRAEPGRI